MKLTHKTIHLKPTQKIENWLAAQSKGLSQIGAGLYAKVYVKDKAKSKRVVKIGIVDNNVIRYGGVTGKQSSFNTDPYCEYLRNVVVPHQDNPFVPKVYSVELFTVHHMQLRREREWPRRTPRRLVPCVNYVYVVKMERLKRWNTVPNTVRTAVLEKCGLPDEFRWKGYDDTMLNDTFGYRIHRNAKSSKNKHLIEIAPKLTKLYRQARFSVDFHEGNVMWRTSLKGQAQPVLVDPIA